MSIFGSVTSSKTTWCLCRILSSLVSDKIPPSSTSSKNNIATKTYTQGTNKCTRAKKCLSVHALQTFNLLKSQTQSESVCVRVCSNLLLCCHSHTHTHIHSCVSACVWKREYIKTMYRNIHSLFSFSPTARNGMEAYLNYSSHFRFSPIVFFDAIWWCVNTFPFLKCAPLNNQCYSESGLVNSKGWIWACANLQATSLCTAPETSSSLQPPIHLERALVGNKASVLSPHLRGNRLIKTSLFLSRHEPISIAVGSSLHLHPLFLRPLVYSAPRVWA